MSSYQLRVKFALFLILVFVFSANVHAKDFGTFSTPDGCKFFLPPYGIFMSATSTNPGSEWSLVAPSEISWTGQCKDGYTDGMGTLAFTTQGTSEDMGSHKITLQKRRWEHEGVMVQGVLNGQDKARYKSDDSDWSSGYGDLYEMGCSKNMAYWDGCKPHKLARQKGKGNRSRTANSQSSSNSTQGSNRTTSSQSSIPDLSIPDLERQCIDARKAIRARYSDIFSVAAARERIKLNQSGPCSGDRDAQMDIENDKRILDMHGEVAFDTNTNQLTIAPNSKLSDKTTPTERTRASSGGSCRDKIIAIQLQGDAKYKANRGNRLSQARAMFETNQAQKELFSGECASEPDAMKYVSSAETSMQEWGSKCQQAGGGSDCGVTSSQSSSNSTHAYSDSSTETSQSSSNSTQAESDVSTGASEDSRKIYDGLVTDHCVRYKPWNRKDGNLAWFVIENGCNETINVWYGNVGGNNYFGSMMKLQAGRSDKSWYNKDKYSGINYMACKEKIHGKDVHIDQDSKSCWYFK